MTLATTDQSLLELLGITELEPDEQEAMLLDLNTLIFEGTLVRLLERMDEATKKDFTELLDTNANEEELLEFLNTHVENAESAVTETVTELKNDILSVTGAGQD